MVIETFTVTVPRKTKDIWFTSRCFQVGKSGIWRQEIAHYKLHPMSGVIMDTGRRYLQVWEPSCDMSGFVALHLRLIRCYRVPGGISVQGESLKLDQLNVY